MDFFCIACEKPLEVETVGEITKVKPCESCLNDSYNEGFSGGENACG